MMVPNLSEICFRMLNNNETNVHTYISMCVALAYNLCSNTLMPCTRNESRKHSIGNRNNEKKKEEEDVSSLRNEEKENNHTQFDCF